MADLLNLVRQTTTTTGTGTVTLGSAISGFLTMALASAVNGATYSYAIETDFDANGVAQKREVGTGVYTSSGTTLTRVLESSTTGALLSLAGTSHVIITPTRATIPGRERLAAARTYYVRTDGSNSNTGLTNTAAGAFLTIQKAVNVAIMLDMVSAVTIQVADGTYAESVTIKGPWLPGAASPWNFLTITGNTVTPANVIVDGFDAIFCYLVVKGFRAKAIKADAAGQIDFHNFEFAANAGGTHFSAVSGGFVLGYTNYSILGSAAYHMDASRGGLIDVSTLTITLTGTPAFTDFAWATERGQIYAPGTTYSGAATGRRYTRNTGGLLMTGGGGANFFPGNVAGISTTGDEYS